MHIKALAFKDLLAPLEDFFAGIWYEIKLNYFNSRLIGAYYTTRYRESPLVNSENLTKSTADKFVRVHAQMSVFPSTSFA